MKKLLGVLLVLIGCAPGHFTLKSDNDFWSPYTHNNDKEYTQGAEFSNTYTDATGSHSYGFGQLVYTPGHKSFTVPQPNDRPYAGYLYGKFTKVYLDYGFGEEETFSIAPGIVGPHSYGKAVQDGFHNLIGQGHPNGWALQLNDEPTLEGTYERNTAYLVSSTFNLVVTTGVNAGTPISQGYISALGKYGYNPPIFGQEVIFPRAPQKPPFRVFLVAGPLVRGVLWNTFLDGNAFQDSASIDKKSFVLEGRLGAGVEWNGYMISFIDIIQTAEFEGQANGTKFAELQIGFNF